MDPKLLYWSGALLNLGLILVCVRLGVRRVRRGDVAGHRRMMLTGAAGVALFFVSYAFKVAMLGKEDRSQWSGFDHALLYVHELCITAMLLAGGLAAFRAWRFRKHLGPALELPSQPLPGAAAHRRAGRVAAVGALLAFGTALGVLAGMFARAGAERVRPTAAVVLSLVALACGGEPAIPTARNLVLVSLDTLRADRLGVYGYQRDTSPNLDAFASQAFVFERAQSAGNATVGAHHAIFQSRPASQAIAHKETAPTLAGLLHSRGWRTAGFTDGGTMSKAMGFARGFQRFDDGNHGLAESLPKALAWLDEVQAGSPPFYLFLHSFDVHLPYDPPPPFDAQFGPAYSGRVEGKQTLRLLRGVRRIFEQSRLPEPVVLGSADRERVNALYDGEIAKTDALLGRLFARLDAADLRDDTLVVVLSDHGEEFWDHGSVLHSHTLYQELLHVPLLLRVPALRERAHRISARVSMIDLLPTLLELVAAAPPPGLRGQSLVPLLEEPDREPAPVAILSEGYPFGLNQQSLVAGRFKLIRTLPTGRVELYDLDADPGEQNDLAAARPGLRKRMLAALDRELPTGAAQVEDPLAQPEDLDPDTRRRLRELGYID